MEEGGERGGGWRRVNRVEEGEGGWRWVEEGGGGWRRVEEGGGGWRRVEKVGGGWRRVFPAFHKHFPAFP